ncbi:transcription termination-antitermination domain-containing protein [Alteromonas phage vB_AmeM_PT11-V22]|uniref:Transcription termination-antitermination domain-containing protein n=1 Tax=Alteromonas phage vB_AmeM_PT11-V22 TaxID=2704031 RepID=A0A6C0R1M4_9CAUD|nr:transcription termination-antitermination domain-containing protein [Alteromonas phage vB_AmeM_PT11-V22]QHZ59776.1 transcription termination-antitermination domain-containing protein [Alteromonas phage vB_AmeM_PT11-V22]
MSDLEKLFEHAPEGAVELRETLNGGYLRWFNKNNDAWGGNEWTTPDCGEYKTLATRPQPQRKTVEDAVDEHKGKWPFSLGVIRMGYSSKLEHYFAFGHGYDFCEGEYLVCTREEFEACVAAKSEPEWTHIYNGEECYIATTYNDCAWVVRRMTDDKIVLLEDLKPIKPTITEKERETVAKFVARIYTKESYDLRKEFDDFVNEHEVGE